MSVSLKKDSDGEIYPHYEQKQVQTSFVQKEQKTDFESLLEKIQSLEKIIQRLEITIKNPPQSITPASAKTSFWTQERKWTLQDILFIILWIALLGGVIVGNIFGWSWAGPLANTYDETVSTNHNLLVGDTCGWSKVASFDWEEVDCDVTILEGFSNPTRYRITFEEESFVIALAVNNQVPEGRYKGYILTARDIKDRKCVMLNIPEVFGTLNEDLEYAIYHQSEYYPTLKHQTIWRYNKSLQENCGAILACIGLVLGDVAFIVIMICALVVRDWYI